MSEVTNVIQDLNYISAPIARARPLGWLAVCCIYAAYNVLARPNLRTAATSNQIGKRDTLRLTQLFRNSNNDRAHRSPMRGPAFLDFYGIVNPSGVGWERVLR